MLFFFLVVPLLLILQCEYWIRSPDLNMHIYIRTTTTTTTNVKEKHFTARAVCVCVTCCLGSFTITAFRCNSRALCICFTSSQHIEREQNTYSRCVYLNAYKYASLPYELKRFISRHIALLIIFSVLSSRCIFIRCKLYTRFHTIAVTILSLFSLLHLAAEVGFGVLLLLLQLHSSCVANFSLQFFSPSTFVKSEGKKR